MTVEGAQRRSLRAVAEVESAQTAPVAAGLDTSKPSIARVYNYWLGGKDNFGADRDEGDRLLEVNPELRRLARENRMFLALAVRRLAAEHGISQFLDLGAGLPAGENNTHEVVQAVSRRCRVVYVDIDPVAAAHGAALLAKTAGVQAVRGDLSDPAAILADDTVRRVIDLDEPVAVVLGMVLHFFDAATAREIVDGYIDVVAPASYLVLSCGSGDDALAREYRAGTLYNHSAETIAGWLAGLKLLEPGLTDARAWAPAPDTAPPARERGHILAAIARKPLTAVTPSSVKAGHSTRHSRPGLSLPACLEAPFMMACQPQRHGLAWCRA